MIPSRYRGIEKTQKEINAVLDEITAEIYDYFMTIDGKVYDKSAIKCMEIISKYKAESEK